MNILGKIYSSIIKKTYGKFNGKLFAFVAYFGCFFACAYLFFIKTKKQIIIAPATAIGDNIYILSFWDNLNKRAEKSDKEILFFISDRYKEILQTYNPPNNKVTVIYLKHCGFKHLFLFTLWLLFKHPHLANFSLKHGIFCPVPSAYKSHIDKLNLVGCRNQLSHILNLPLEPISYHKQALTPINCIENFKEHHNRICVINPYSYSMYSNVQLFEKFVIELKKRGYIIYTNVIRNQRAIEGVVSRVFRKNSLSQYQI